MKDMLLNALSVVLMVILCIIISSGVFFVVILPIGLSVKYNNYWLMFLYLPIIFIVSIIVQIMEGLIE